MLTLGDINKDSDILHSNMPLGSHVAACLQLNHPAWQQEKYLTTLQLTMAAGI